MTASESKSGSLVSRLRSVQVGRRGELEISRHIFRGEPSYVVQDPITFTSHHLTAHNYQIFVALDSERPLERIFERLVEHGVLKKDREEDFYRFVVRLNQLGLLNLPISDGKRLYERFQKKRGARRRNWLTAIVFLRVPLVQPDAFLTRTMRYAAPLFTRLAFALWLLGVSVSLYVVAMRWEAFCNPLGTMLAAKNLPILWTLLVGMKVIHEFGHAYACKFFGGRVPEMGAFFVVFTPCAYVDASATWGFTNRLHRIIVGLAGMYFESMAAMAALAVWCFTEPSPLRSIAHYAVILSTIVTVGFNINPLMRYDGYYILSDAVNTPNLRQLASAQIIVTLKRVALGIRVPDIASTQASRIGLAFFGIAAGLYRLLVLMGISAVVALKIPAAGLGIAVSFLAALFWKFGTRLVGYVAWSQEAAPVRRRAVAVTVGVFVCAVASLLWLPTPGSIQMTGVVRRRDDRTVRSSGSGFLQRVDVRAGDVVPTGAAMATLENIDVVSALKKKRAELDQLRVQLHARAVLDPKLGAATQRQLERAERERAHLEREVRRLVVRAPIPGQITEIQGLEDRGRFVRKGEPLATVSAGPWVLNAVATEETLTTWEPRKGDQVEVRLVSQGGRSFSGRVIHLVPAGSKTIEDPALTHLGGGSIAVSASTMEADQPFFEIVIVIDDPDNSVLRPGMTAVAVFDGHRVPLGTHFYRRTLHFLNMLRASG